MICVYLGTFTPPAAWLGRAQGLTDSLMAHIGDKTQRKAILDAVANHIWGQLKAELEILSFGKCWYSEAREIASHYHVDHFRPQKRCTEKDGSHLDGYWWLAYRWNNYRISAEAVNSAKQDKFAVHANRATDPANPAQIDDEIFYLLDPLSEDDAALITFNGNGEAMPLNPDEHAWEHKRAKYTIETLKLNSPKLRRARKIRWKQCSELIESTRAKIQEYNATPTAGLRAKVTEMKNQVRDVVSPRKELSGTYKACVRSSREDWGLNILQEPINYQALQQQYRESIQ